MKAESPALDPATVEACARIADEWLVKFGDENPQNVSAKTWAHSAVASMERLRGPSNSTEGKMKLDWGQEDRFVSNNGKGPLVARILSCTNSEVTMERWHKRKPAHVMRFTLSLKYFCSSECGWQKASCSEANHPNS